MSDSREQLNHQSTSPKGPENNDSAPKISGNEKVKQGAESVLGATESADSNEDGGEAMGNVSESNSEDKKQASQSGAKGGKTMTTDEIEQLRAKLLANAPAQTDMIRQIKKVLNDQEHKLENDFSRLVSNPQKNPEKFVEVVSKMRQIRVYLDSMLNATYEYVKHMWLKIVHGI